MTVPDIEAISTNLLICAFNMHLCWREISRCGQKRQTCIFKVTKAPVCYRLRPVSQTCPLYFKCHLQCYIMALLKDNTAYHTLAHTFITEHRSTFHIRCWKSIPDDWSRTPTVNRPLLYSIMFHFTTIAQFQNYISQNASGKSKVSH